MKAVKLPSGNWRIQVYLGKTEDGKKIRKSFTGENRKQLEAEAHQFLNFMQFGNVYIRAYGIRKHPTGFSSEVFFLEWILPVLVGKSAEHCSLLFCCELLTVDVINNLFLLKITVSV